MEEINESIDIVPSLEISRIHGSVYRSDEKNREEIYICRDGGDYENYKIESNKEEF